MILLNNLSLPLDTDFDNLSLVAAKELKTDFKNIKVATLYKKSVDARHKGNIRFCCSVLVAVNKNEEKLISNCHNATAYQKKEYIWKKVDIIPKKTPVVVGFGPAGMFAALTLARAGLKPLVIERGGDVETRTNAVSEFLNGGKLDRECNVQFGEGGAGTFSDGKLNTGTKNPRSATVLKVFAEKGAPKKILTDAKPHIGTDILVNVVKNIREEIISLGGEVRFNTKLENLGMKDGKLEYIVANGVKIPCDKVIIACGHSARDTFKMLLDSGVEMEQKPFSVGVRIEHLQSSINKALYGEFWDSEYLGAADYKMAVHLKSGRGVYTFCMCPGGEVINASSEVGGIAINGMSRSLRDGENANSALLVGVEPDDFPGDDVLAGCRLQEKIEQKAFSLKNGSVPITTVGHFVFSKEAKIGTVKPTVKPNYFFAEMEEIFPAFVTDSLKEGITLFDKKIEGFATEDAVITAPETRSSSPVRILRGEELESISVGGIYPCGEGAGYAGGIVSAAVDGMVVAEKIIDSYGENR